MNHLLDTDTEEAQTADREISLGLPTILGIFFGLALLCAVFFGFGYSVGRKSAPPAIATVPVPATSFGSAKPAAGSIIPQRAQPSPAPQPDTPPPATAETPAAVPTAKNGLTPADAMIAGDKLPAASPQSATINLQPPTVPNGAFMVQIAAVSSQQIADIELAALKKYGYAVVVRHEPQDQLLHVQIGPYATRKDAETMRQNVLAHGFNAIVK